MKNTTCHICSKPLVKQQKKYCSIECAAKRTKLTSKYVKEVFAQANCLLLSEYESYTGKLDFICSCGRKTTITYVQFKKSKECRECALERISEKYRFTYEYVNKFFEEQDYQLLSKEYKNAEQKLEYICANGHHGTIAFTKFSRGQRCAICSKVAPHSHEYVKDYFAEHGYELLTQYTKAAAQVTCRCPKGHEFTTTYNRFQGGKRCQKCFYDYNKGENHYWWNAEQTLEERERKRNYPEYTQWRIKVYERDNYICQSCGNKSGNGYAVLLRAHHVYNYSEHKELRTDIDNGITLCKECHEDFHNIYSRRNNTKEQLEEYLGVVAC